jgi:hypothetical protein
MSGTAMQFVRVISRVEDMEIWNASRNGFSFVISYESHSGPGLQPSRLDSLNRLGAYFARNAGADRDREVHVREWLNVLLAGCRRRDAE